tara:strand:+ start:485 stop:691 length:207 start_codon:yes stop_codon:yes gene_type:complete
MVRTKDEEDTMTNEDEPRPLSVYEQRHGLTVEMRSIKGPRRTRKYRWEHERYDNATMTWAEKEEETDE